MSVISNKQDQVSKAIVAYNPKEASTNALNSKISSSYRNILESQYLNTYKAFYLGGKETAESSLIRTATICPIHSNSEISQRIDKYKKVSEHLNHLSNDEFSTFIESITSTNIGTGGVVCSAAVAGIPVFIKKIPLTTIEKQHRASTANLFELPLNYQYGVGSTGFGVWRDLAAHEMTTNWVLNGECQNFPLMYHSRILERATLTEPTEDYLEYQQELSRDWGGVPAIDKRHEAIIAASADVVVIMESIPQNLNKWLSLSEGQENITDYKITKLEQEVDMVVTFMKSRGFLHFDAHAGNILPSDNHFYFTDFGLAISQEFDLSPQERAFFNTHSDYDRYYIIQDLVLSAMTAVLGYDGGDAAWAAYLETGEVPAALPTPIASIAERYKPIAVLMGNFIQDCRKDRSTPYPAVELALEWSKLQKK